MADRLALRFVSRCQTVDQFARVFCAHAQADRLAVPLAMEPPPVGTRLRAAIALANKLGVIEGDAEIVGIVAGSVELRFHALDPRSRGFLAHLVANRATDPAPVPRHLVPMGAAVAGGPTTADPALGTCLIEALGGSGPVPQAVDINATTRTAAAPPAARRELPPVDPARAAAAAARAARRDAPTVTGVPVMGPGTPAARLAARAPAGGGTVGAALDDGMTVPTPAALLRRAAHVDSGPHLDDLETDLVAALPDARGDESDPTIDPPPPSPLRPMMSGPGMSPAPMAGMSPSPMAGMSPSPMPMAGMAPAPMGTYPPSPAAPSAYPVMPGMAPPMAYPAPAMAPPGMAPPGMAPPGMAPPAMPPPAMAPRPMTPPQSMPPPGLGPPPPVAAPASVVLSPANVGSAVAGPASASAWPMPAQPQGWVSPPAATHAPAQGGYPTAQLPALGYDGGGGARRPGLPRDRRRPVEMESDPDLTEIVTVPRSRARAAARRRWPVIVVTSVIVLLIVIAAIVAATTGGDEPSTTTPGPAPTTPPAATPGPGTAPPAATPAAAAPPAATPPAATPPAATPPAATPPAATPPAATPSGDPPAATPPTPAPAAAPAATASGPCTIAFASSPDGAAVSLDGKALGTTPFTAEVACSKQTFTYKRERYRTERTTVEPHPGEQTVRVRLDRPTFKVKVTSRPAGATITIGDEVVGKTPATVSVQGFENVTLELTRSGFAPQRQKVHVTRAGESVDVVLRKRR